MAERRSLTDGLKATPDMVDPEVFKTFVHGDKAETAPPLPAAATPNMQNANGQARNSISRVPFTTRIRGDFAELLKRASLERQLSGTFPNSQQEILEEALEPWLKSNGYLK